MKIKKGWYIVFVAPLMIMFSIIQLIPFFTGLAYSFVDWNGLSKSPKVFVGIQNYIKIFSDSNFGMSWSMIVFHGASTVFISDW